MLLAPVAETVTAPTVDWLNSVVQLMLENAVPIAWKIVGAILLWIVGGMLISVARAAFGRALHAKQVDRTFGGYLETSLGVLLRIILVIAILGVFGVESTSFAAVLAAAGVAIGMAWSGLLANFAAGIFLVVLRPFKVGDVISAGGITGEVKEIGLFVTALDTPDNVRTYVGNNKIFSDNITNYNTNGARRVELQMQVAGSVDLNALMAKVAARVATIPNVLKTPAVEVNIATFNLAGPVLNVRPYCNNDHYWQVLADTNAAINECGAGLPPPAPHQVMIQKHG
ncbi:MAG TPA: mechanosensitive ion channel family protein [Nannocystaceae bacterium]|nr:mechanosensitive ion channel family protein [Nannocystaceae bacterium]